MSIAEFIERGRVFGEWLMLAICAGAILGVASRVAMRIVALEAHEDVGFSVGGSLEVVSVRRIGRNAGRDRILATSRLESPAAGIGRRSRPAPLCAACFSATSSCAKRP